MDDLDALVERLRANAQVCRDEQKRPLPPASKAELANNAREWDNAAEAITRLREQCVVTNAPDSPRHFTYKESFEGYLQRTLGDDYTAIVLAALAAHAKSECPKCVVVTDADVRACLDEFNDYAEMNTPETNMRAALETFAHRKSVAAECPKCVVAEGKEQATVADWMKRDPAPHDAAARLSTKELVKILLGIKSHDQDGEPMVTMHVALLRRITAALVESEGKEQALRELCDAYPPFFPNLSRSVCVECHEVMSAEVLAILDRTDTTPSPSEATP